MNNGQIQAEDSDKVKNLSKEQLLELLQAYQSMLKTPESRQVFVQKVSQATDLSIRQRRANSMPYYKERFAKELKSTIDLMLEDKKNRIYLFKNFKSISKTSLYLRIHQAFLYIVDNMDEAPEFKYAKAREFITVSKRPEGVILEIIENLSEPKILENNAESLALASTKIPEKLNREWKTKIEDFMINGAINSKLSIRELKLDKDDIEEIELMFTNLENQFLWKIDSNSIIVIKVDPKCPPSL